jgi:hypothetical protein
MSVTAERPSEQIQSIEQLVDSGFEAAVSALTMWQAWAKVVLTAPYGYSPAAEAANLLARATQGSGAHASEQG